LQLKLEQTRACTFCFGQIRVDRANQTVNGRTN
jgi:hypothetical protein